MVDWKKDVSFGGGKKKEKPSGDANESTSIWKKEIGGKKDKQPKQPKAEKQPRASKPDSDVPFWKKEISFGGGMKNKAVDAAPAGDQTVDVDLPASVELLNA